MHQNVRRDICGTVDEEPIYEAPIRFYKKLTKTWNSEMNVMQKKKCFQTLHIQYLHIVAYTNITKVVIRNKTIVFYPRCVNTVCQDIIIWIDPQIRWVLTSYFSNWDKFMSLQQNSYKFDITVIDNLQNTWLFWFL